MYSVPHSPHDPYYTPPAQYAGFHYPCFRVNGSIPLASGVQMPTPIGSVAMHDDTESVSSRGRALEQSGVSSARSRSAASTESGEAGDGSNSRPRSRSQPPAVVVEG